MLVANRTNENDRQNINIVDEFRRSCRKIVTRIIEINFLANGLMAVIQNRNNNGIKPIPVIVKPTKNASRTNIRTVDNSVKFNVTINFTKQDIQFGASSYWIKIPVDATFVQRVMIFNNSVVYDEMGEILEYTRWDNDTWMLDIARSYGIEKRVIWDVSGIIKI